MKNKHTIRAILLFVLVLIEVLSSTHWQQSMSMQWCRWLHLTAGIGVVIILFFKPVPVQRLFINRSWLPFLLWLLLVVWLVPGFYRMFQNHPLDYTHADMLPVIEVMVQRWITNSPVYEIIPQYWNGVLPVYLPALWLPFVPAVLFAFDLRWITLGMLFFALLYLLMRKKSTPWSWFIFIPIGLWFNYLRHNRTETFLLSQEGVVYAYYILLVVALYVRHQVAIGISLALCLLSRYGIAFFAIGLILSCFIQFEGKKRFITFLSASLTGIFLLGITGAWKNLFIFLNLPGEYLKNIATFQSKYQDVLNDGLGLVPMIYLDYMSWMYSTMVFLLIAAATCMVFYCRRFYHRFYFLAFLKLSLIVFYNLLMIPYQYLFFTSIWVSIAICFLYMNHCEPTSVIESV